MKCEVNCIEFEGIEPEALEMDVATRNTCEAAIPTRVEQWDKKYKSVIYKIQNAEYNNNRQMITMCLQ